MPTKTTKTTKTTKMRMTKKKGMTNKKSMPSTSGEEMPAWCVHERKPCIMINAYKEIITMKNGNKRAMMKGECKSCGKNVTKFTKM